MSFLSGFIGGVAGAYNAERDAEKLDARKKQLAEYESELKMKRLVMEETLREKFAQATAKAKRDQDVADGKTIQDTSEAKRVERSQGIINQDTGLNYSPDEVKKIIADPDWVNNYGARHDTANGKSTEWTEGGLINQRTSLTPSTDRTAYQEQMDLSNAAGGIGRTDLQGKYTQAADSERRFQTEEDRTKEMARRTDLQEIEGKRKEKADRGREEIAANRLEALVKGFGKKAEKDNSPAEVRAVEWYMKNQDDPKAMAAWNKVHESKSKNIITIAAGLLSQKDQLTGAPTFTTEQAYKQASDLYDLAASKNSATPAAPAPTPGKTYKYNPKTGKVE